MSAVAMSYGDLNAGSGLGKLDGGSERDGHGTAVGNLAAAGYGWWRLGCTGRLDSQCNEHGRSCQPGSMKRRRGRLIV